MTSRQEPGSAADATGVSELVSSAKEIGEVDESPGKRRWIRYRAGMQLEVTSDTREPCKIQPVIMHSASGGGFAFWARKPLRVKSLIFVREYSSDVPNDWLAACVCHCTVGIRGFLVGAAFEDPAQPMDESSAS